MRVAAAAMAEHDAVVLLGMGGSSLAPEVLVQTFGVEGFHVLDTTHPEAIRRLEAKLDLERTLFVSASKSGSTLETRSHTDYFWEQARDGAHWIAITDPGSELEKLARERGFRHVFAGEPTIGGRYSALSPFGMAPAALMGIDLVRLLDGALEMADACRSDGGNRGLQMGLGWGEAWVKDATSSVSRAAARSGSGRSSSSPSRPGSSARVSSPPRARRARARTASSRTSS